MLTIQQKQHYTYLIIGWLMVIVIAFIFGYQAILPKYENISILVSDANASIDKYNGIKIKGLTRADIVNDFKSSGNKNEIIKLIEGNVSETEKIIAKPAGVSGDYLSWIQTQIAQSEDDKRKLEAARAQLNTILPTLLPINSNIDEENLTLKQFTRYMEQEFLSKLGITSTESVGITGLKSGKQAGYPENISSFDISLSFKGGDDDIANFITKIQKSGNPETIFGTGVEDTNKPTGIMSNPLMTLVNMSIQKPVSKSIALESKSTVSATIRFYVRGGSENDTKTLEGVFAQRIASFKEKVKKAQDDCKKDKTICINGEDRETLAKKLQEFEKNLPTPVGDTQTRISIIGQNLNTLKALDSELNEIINKK